MSQKAIYEVTVEVDSEIAAEYLKWLREHMKQIVDAAGFERAEMWALKSDSSTVKTWVIQYIARSMKTVDDYLAHHSKMFRADGVERFGGRFRIERRILSFQEAVPDLTGPASS